MEEETQFDKLPEELELRVKEQLELSETPKVVLRADIRADGVYGDMWLVVTEHAFMMVSPDHANRVEVRRIPLGSVSAVYIHNFVGNSVVELETDEGSIEAARYTRTMSDKFADALPVFRSLVKEAGLRDEAKIRRSRRRAKESGEESEQPVKVDTRSSTPIVPQADEVTGPDEEETGARGRGGAPRKSTVEEGPPIARKIRCEKCGRALPPEASRCPYCTPKAAIFFRSLTFLRPFLPWVLVVFLITVVSSGLTVVPPLFQRRMIDDGILAGSREALLKYWSWWLWVLVVGLGVGGIRGFLGPWLGQRVILNVRAGVYQHLQRLALSFYQRNTTGNLMQRVTSDTDRLQEFLSTWVPEFVHSVLMIVLIGVILVYSNARLAAASLVSIPVMAVLTFFLMRWLRRVYHKAWRYWASLSSLLGDAIPGVKVVRAFAQEDREIKRFNRRSYNYYGQMLRAIKVHALYHPAVEFLIMVGTMVVWLYGGGMVIASGNGEDAMSMGTLYMFLRYIFMFYWPVRMLTMLSRMVQRALTSADRVFEVLDTEPGIQNAPNAVVKVPVEGAVEFKNVWFRYDEGEPVLKDISFSIEPGEMIGLAGPSGAGKSTLINLLARFYDVSSGGILIDGTDIKELEIKSFRDQIGMVLQDPFLFSGSIGMNIGYGKPGATQEEIVVAAKAANAHDFISQLPDAYDTEVGERGVRLSGGERQRVSIARAILKNPRLLILDEATSSVDTETEAKIQEALERLVENRTTFAIAHRLSTLKRANRLLILKEGDLVEQGNHSELMKMDGVYARLCKMQAEMAKVRAV